MLLRENTDRFCLIFLDALVLLLTRRDLNAVHRKTGKIVRRIFSGVFRSSISIPQWPPRFKSPTWLNAFDDIESLLSMIG